LEISPPGRIGYAKEGGIHFILGNGRDPATRIVLAAMKNRKGGGWREEGGLLGTIKCSGALGIDNVSRLEEIKEGRGKKASFNRHSERRKIKENLGGE